MNVSRDSNKENIRPNAEEKFQFIPCEADFNLTMKNEIKMADYLKISKETLMFKTMALLMSILLNPNVLLIRPETLDDFFARLFACSRDNVLRCIPKDVR